ncbi:MAG TPA: membrane protein insertase YidC [Candidatus Binatia bacterium]|nr:membrane protein insertase YidC [Candidatus Binatia bacterium]
MITVENRRFALITALGIVLFLLYQAWQQDHPAAPAATAPAVPVAAAPAAADAATAPPAAPAAPGESAPPPSALAATGETRRIHVDTDVMSVEIALQGGDLRRAELKGFAVAKQQPDVNVALLDDRDDHWFVIQSGLAGTQQPVASHEDRFTAEKEFYTLAEGADAVEVPLQLVRADGARVTKRYRFHRGTYVVDLEQHLDNGSAAPLAASAYVQMWRTPFALGEEPRFLKTFMGLGVYERKPSGDFRFRKIDFKDLQDEPLSLQQSGGWVAMLQHYFFAAILPPAGEPATLAARPSATRGYVAQYLGAPKTAAPGQAADFAVRLYVGPTRQGQLAALAPGLELTEDYGILAPIAKPLFWLLSWFHRLTHNWGFAIILLTLAVRLAMFKLSEAQFRSMAKMKKYAPRIQELKERHADDRARLNQAMMELYKKEKFNPLAGCWPLLVQMPVFFALYWVLLQSVELRQADFALWIHDLSSPDPFYVLPVLFGVSMFLQQKLSGNVVADPMQQRMMGMMPWMMSVFFAFFPAGLVLYWFVSNLVSIAQQWVINRRLAREGLRH